MNSIDPDSGESNWIDSGNYHQYPALFISFTSYITFAVQLKQKVVIICLNCIKIQVTAESCSLSEVSEGVNKACVNRGSREHMLTDWSLASAEGQEVCPLLFLEMNLKELSDYSSAP